MTKGELRAARKAARAEGLNLTGELRPASSGPVQTSRPPRRRGRSHENSMYRWARRYDALNGAPESDSDR